MTSTGAKESKKKEEKKKTCAEIFQETGKIKTYPKVFKRDREIFDEVAGQVEELRKHPSFSDLLNQSIEIVKELYTQELKSLHKFYDLLAEEEERRKEEGSLENWEVPAYHPVRLETAGWWNEYAQDGWDSDERFALEFFTVCVVHDGMKQYDSIISKDAPAEVVCDIWNCVYAIGEHKSDKKIKLSDARLRTCLKDVTCHVQKTNKKTNKKRKLPQYPEMVTEAMKEMREKGYPYRKVAHELNCRFKPKKEYTDGNLRAFVSKSKNK